MSAIYHISKGSNIAAEDPWLHIIWYCNNVSFSTDEAKRWIECLSPTGGCNVLKALRQVFKVKDVDSVLLILGSA